MQVRKFSCLLAHGTSYTPEWASGLRNAVRSYPLIPRSCCVVASPNMPTALFFPRPQILKWHNCGLGKLTLLSSETKMSNGVDGMKSKVLLNKSC